MIQSIFPDERTTQRTEFAALAPSAPRRNLLRFTSRSARLAHSLPRHLLRSRLCLPSRSTRLTRRLRSSRLLCCALALPHELRRRALYFLYRSVRTADDRVLRGVCFRSNRTERRSDRFRHTNQKIL